MKNQLAGAGLALGAIVLGTNYAQAQETATSAVNINMEDVISIDAGSLAKDGEVNFYYNTAEDYQTTQTITIANSLIVTSAKEFDIKVRSGGKDFENGENTIPVKVLTITAKGGTMEGKKESIKIGHTDKSLVKKAPYGSKLTLDLDYEIAGKDASKEILGKPLGTYTQTVTYTASAS
ncbi:hypothetical protein KCTC52924_00836 [Arenibacter antarcticus]|uniref:Peptidoglycan-binding protein LysM n=1 Tax=Arenibacter antarcticus TaxID=2040469 RepID=A0ABW5VA56_9FLAO|nr:peptidoglycan-binding protein LysM [Arenibacter sp. H213]MCM4167651.1 peptidoglycan-binding protein LysM [Arenibacter sp. H213]